MRLTIRKFTLLQKVLISLLMTGEVALELVIPSARTFAIPD